MFKLNCKFNNITLCLDNLIKNCLVVLNTETTFYHLSTIVEACSKILKKTANSQMNILFVFFLFTSENCCMKSKICYKIDRSPSIVAERCFVHVGHAV